VANPYRIEGPALISFSGGRTSGYMLWHILDAYGGKLPTDVHVCFANTGKEREETLRFVHECESRWVVDIAWLEWRKRERGSGWDEGFKRVGYNSASRDGEPFAALIEDRKMLPNPVTRFCTQQLKVRTMEMFMRTEGYERWNNAVGLRWDEMRRVFKQIERNEKGTDRFTAIMPMATRATQVTEPQVLAWWARQPFNLELRGYEGNCDLCFLKQERTLHRLVRDNPGMAEWWRHQEHAHEGRTRDPRMSKFNKAFTYDGIVAAVSNQPLLKLDYMTEDEEFDAECGLWCAGEEAA
jgi:3'-phosphoadenosine 5'-phosphosulfate sulfotransferase (PAPS reductase)/FAD synthetase